MKRERWLQGSLVPCSKKSSLVGPRLFGEKILCARKLQRYVDVLTDYNPTTPTAIIMTLLAPGCTVAGVPLEELEEKWSKFTSEGLQVDESSLGGIGLFYNCAGQQQCEQDPIVLRVPVEQTYNLATCMEILDELKATGEKDYKIILSLLSTLEPETETVILICYVVGLVYISNRGDQVSESVRQIVSKHGTYLKVLSNTFTIDYPKAMKESDDQPDPVIDCLFKNAQKVKLLYDLIEKDAVLDTEYMTFEQFYQLVQAVSSRVLEVPEEVEKNGDDFYVSPTLVPLLDFANHSFAPNAYFDLDRQANCVVLKLDKDKIPSNATRFEVTISYSSERQLGPFLSTYGFVPTIDLEAPEGFTVDIPTSFWQPEDNLKRKWLGVPSKVQIVRNGANGTYSIQYPDLLMLVFDKDLHLNPKWPAYITKLLKDDYLPEDIEHVIEDIKTDQKHNDIIQNNGNLCGLMYGDNGEVMTMEMAYEIHSSKSAQLQVISDKEILNILKQYCSQLKHELSANTGGSSQDPRSFESLVLQYRNAVMTNLNSIIN